VDAEEEINNKCKKKTTKKKPQCISIATPQKLSKCRKLCLNVGDIFIENVKCVRLLDVYIDECLTWSPNRGFM
jgi:hypothetical protein